MEQELSTIENSKFIERYENVDYYWREQTIILENEQTPKELIIIWCKPEQFCHRQISWPNDGSTSEFFNEHLQVLKTAVATHFESKGKIKKGRIYCLYDEAWKWRNIKDLAEKYSPSASVGEYSKLHISKIEGYKP